MSSVTDSRGDLDRQSLKACLGDRFSIEPFKGTNTFHNDTENTDDTMDIITIKDV